MSSFWTAVLEWAAKTFSAAQICWVCIAITIGATLYVQQNYVQAAGLKDLQAQVRELRVSQMEQKVATRWKFYCQAQAGNDQSHIDDYFNSYRGAQQAYRDLVGTEIRLPSCQDMRGTTQ